MFDEICRIVECGAVQKRVYENLKKGKLMGLTKQDKKGYFAVLTRNYRAACYLHHPGAVHCVTGFIF